MRPLPLRLPTESTIGRDGQEANARLINAYPEFQGQDQDGKATFTTYPVPGLTRFNQTAFAGVERGMILLDETDLIAVLGTQVVQFNTAGVATVLPSLPGTGRITMARNLNSTPEIGIVTASGQYYYLQGGVLTQPAEANLPTPNSIAYLGGYFVFGIGDGTNRIFHTPPLDTATGISALAFGYAASNADIIVRVYAFSGYLFVFKSKSMEVWQNVGTAPFAFTPVQQFIQLGLGAKFSLADNQSGMFWVDHKGIVRNGRDASAARISTHTIERAIAALSTSDRAAIVGHMVTWEGHECYQISAPSSWTWCFDTGTQRWFQRASFNSARWIGNNAINFAGQYIVSNYTNGNLYTLDTTNYSEDSAEYIMELWCPNSNAFPGGMVIDRLDVDVISGQGVIAAGPPDNVNPMLAIDYSDNGGKTFQGERQVSLGQGGQFSQPVRANNWGRVSHKGRIWRFRASPSVMRGIIQAYVTGRLANA
jgi:hypothetical protein